VGMPGGLGARIGEILRDVRGGDPAESFVMPLNPKNIQSQKHFIERKKIFKNKTTEKRTGHTKGL